MRTPFAAVCLILSISTSFTVASAPEAAQVERAEHDGARRHHAKVIRATSTSATLALGRGRRTSTTTTKPATTTAKPASTSTKAALTSTKSTSIASSSKPAATATPVKIIKKGLSYDNDHANNTLPFGNSVGWTYNWFSEPKGVATTPGVVFLPMLWGTRDPWLTQIWSANAKKAIQNGASHLLGFNEPDLQGQAEMTVAQAVAAWKQYMEPFAGQAKLVAPAITNGGAPGGVQYMKDFLAACTGCHIDAIATHWYDAAWNTGYFFNYFNDAIKAFAPRPILITEFRGSGTVAEQVKFIKTVVPWLNNQTAIDKYAIFGAFDGPAAAGNMITGGKLNEVGIAYRDAK